MHSWRAKAIFRLALALSLVSICLSSYVLGRAQSGPSWEVPVAVVQELRTIPVMSTTLIVAALLIYVLSRRFGEVAERARLGFIIVTVIAIVLPLMIWIFDPAQWPFQFETLSFLAMILIVPTVVGSLVFFWLIGFRWVEAE